MPFKLEQVTLADTLTEWLTPAWRMPHRAARSGSHEWCEALCDGDDCGHGADTGP